MKIPDTLPVPRGGFWMKPHCVFALAVAIDVAIIAVMVALAHVL